MKRAATQETYCHRHGMTIAGNMLKEFQEDGQKALDELSWVQGLPSLDCARAGATIMQVAAKLARAGNNVDARDLQGAVDLWSTYTGRLEADLKRFTAEG